MGAIVRILGSVFTPTGAVVAPLLLVLGLLIWPSIDKILGAVGYETRTVLRVTISDLRIEVDSKNTQIKALEAKVKRLEETIVAIGKIQSDVGKADSKTDKDVGDFLGSLAKSIKPDEMNNLMTVPVENVVDIGIEILDDEIRVGSVKPKVVEEVVLAVEVPLEDFTESNMREEARSLSNITVMNNAYERFFGDMENYNVKDV